jgi:hypothetical protein
MHAPPSFERPDNPETDELRKLDQAVSLAGSSPMDETPAIDGAAMVPLHSSEASGPAPVSPSKSSQKKKKKKKEAKTKGTPEPGSLETEVTALAQVE